MHLNSLFFSYLTIKVKVNSNKHNSIKFLHFKELCSFLLSKSKRFNCPIIVNLISKS